MFELARSSGDLRDKRRSALQRTATRAGLAFLETLVEISIRLPTLIESSCIGKIVEGIGSGLVQLLE